MSQQSIKQCAILYQECDDDESSICLYHSLGRTICDELTTKCIKVFDSTTNTIFYN